MKRLIALLAWLILLIHAPAIAQVAPPIGVIGPSGVSSPVDLSTIYGPGNFSGANGAGSDLFVWDNPSGTTVAGYNLLRVWMGSTPTATPGANSNVAMTIGAVNGNNRIQLWAANFLAIQCGTSAGCTDPAYKDGPLVSLELDIATDASYSTWNRNIGHTVGTYGKNGLEIYGQTGTAATLGQLTAGEFIWNPNSDGSGWFNYGVEVARILKAGFACDNVSGDTQAAYSTGCLSDDSNSTNVVNVTGTHTSFVSFSSASAMPTEFALGLASGTTDWRFTNAANATNGITIDSGSNAGAISYLQLSNQNAVKWAVYNSATNVFNIGATTASSSLAISSTEGIFTVALEATKNFSGAVPNTGANGLAMGWNLSNGSSEADFINMKTTSPAISFSWYQQTSTTAASLEMSLTTTSLTLGSGISITAPGTATGTPAASLCLDASNKIIKKTTTGSCI